jgi:RES domain
MTAFQDFAHSVKAEMRFVRTSRQEKFLQYVIATSRPRIAKLTQGSELWRAQLGHDWCERIVDGDKPIPVRCGYKPERMKPRPNKASDGRTNPKAIPSLYLATRAEAAILEVRPLIGSYISVARFWLSKDIEIIDCTTDHFHWLDLTHMAKSRERKERKKRKNWCGEM